MVHTTDGDCAADPAEDTTSRRDAGPEEAVRTGPSDSLRLMCAWCRRVKTADYGWLATTLDASDRSTSHGICPECEAQTLDAAERSRSTAAATGARHARSRPSEDR